MKRTKVSVRHRPKHPWFPWRVWGGANSPFGGGANSPFDFRSKRDAVAWARGVAQVNQPSTLVITGRDGRIQEERTYPRSSDPRRSKG